MGNTCATCGEDDGGRELSFAHANPEAGAHQNQNRGVRGNHLNKESSVHEYSSKPNMSNRNDKTGPSFSGNNNPNDHQPPSHIATAVTSMNPISKTATGAVSKLPRFQNTQSSKNPEFGPLKYKSNGDTYKGQYYQGLKNGFGELTTTKGEGYIGEFKDDLKHGKGRLVFENGDLYEGEFKSGIAEGKGKFYNQMTGSVYEGTFKNNTQNGKGKELFKDGAYYEGDFVNDQKSGNGLFVFADGSKYTGMFKNDDIEGRGKIELIFTQGSNFFRKIRVQRWKSLQR